MRTLLASLVILASAFTTQLVADTDEARTLAQYNKWVCASFPPNGGFNAQAQFGESDWFPAGSGGGQQARNYAYSQSRRACFNFYQSCNTSCYRVSISY